jgi:hypothetical protein
MKIKALALASILMLPAFAGATTPAVPADVPSLAIKADGDFQTALIAAIVKKKVPVTVVEDSSKAAYTLKSAAVYSKDESNGGKVVRCLFADCIGMNGYSSVSVQLVRNSDDAVVWAYQVRKGNSGPLGIQSLSEAIAKHLKNDYLEKQR